MEADYIKQVCPVCDKEYIPAVEHSYLIDNIKRRVVSKGINDALKKKYSSFPVCSYTCMRKFEKSGEAGKNEYLKKAEGLVKKVAQNTIAKTEEEKKQSSVLGERLRQFRESRGIYKIELGHAVGMSGTTVRAIESGRYVIADCYLERLAEYYGVTVAELKGEG